MPATLPKKIGGYKPTQSLGHGSMGDVWLCHDPSLDRMVVVKQINSQLRSQEDFVSRFTREARILAQLNHPVIVQPYALWQETDGQLSLSMEFVHGKSLRQILDRVKRPPIWVTLAIMYEAFDALSEVHRSGVIHRDLKPSNLMLDNNGRIRLLDFGVAHLDESFETYTEDDDLTLQGSTIGTAAYMSPEQVVNAEVTPSSDLFSMGIVLSEMLLGENVFRGTKLQETYQKIRQLRIKPSAFSKEIPKPLVKFTLSLLKKNPAKRPYSAANVADELSRMLQRYPRDLHPYLSMWLSDIMEGRPSTIEPIPYPKRTRRIFFAGLTLGVILSTSIALLVHAL